MAKKRKPISPKSSRAAQALLAGVLQGIGQKYDDKRITEAGERLAETAKADGPDPDIMVNFTAEGFNRLIDARNARHPDAAWPRKRTAFLDRLAREAREKR